MRINRLPHTGPAFVLLLTIVLLAGSFLLAAGCKEAPSRDPIARGGTSYKAYCMSCHGQDGKGQGPVAEVLTVPPTDLTRLSAQQGGAFPVDGIYETIDGRDEVAAHGTREMPVWGNIWLDVDGKRVGNEIIEQRVNELVEYLRSIQE